jgi:uncharacterized protein YjbJ (UPF0337 family)
MKPSTKDEIKGTFHEVKGKVKEKAGQVTNNPDLKAEGEAEHTAGKVEKKVGQIEKVLEKSVKYDVKNGVVTLTGEVNSQSRRALADRIASAVPNVKQVVNDVQIKEQKATSSN